MWECLKELKHLADKTLYATLFTCNFFFKKCILLSSTIKIRILISLLGRYSGSHVKIVLLRNRGLETNEILFYIEDSEDIC